MKRPTLLPNWQARRRGRARSPHSQRTETLFPRSKGANCAAARESALALSKALASSGSPAGPRFEGPVGRRERRRENDPAPGSVRRDHERNGGRSARPACGGTETAWQSAGEACGIQERVDNEILLGPMLGYPSGLLCRVDGKRSRCKEVPCPQRHSKDNPTKEIKGPSSLNVHSTHVSSILGNSSKITATICNILQQ